MGKGLQLWVVSIILDRSLWQVRNSQQCCRSSAANGRQLVPVWLRWGYEKLGLLQTYGENRTKEPAKLSTWKDLYGPGKHCLWIGNVFWCTKALAWCKMDQAQACIQFCPVLALPTSPGWPRAAWSAPSWSASCISVPLPLLCFPVCWGAGRKEVLFDKCFS